MLLREWGRVARLQGICLGSDPFQFQSEPRELVKRAGGGRGRVQVHGGSVGERVREGIVGPALDRFPGAQHIKSGVWGGLKGIREFLEQGAGVSAEGNPPAGELSSISRQGGVGHAGMPRGKSMEQEGAQGGEGLSTGLSFPALFRWGIVGGAPA